MKIFRNLLVAAFMTAGFTSIAQDQNGQQAAANTITATEAHITIDGSTSREQLMQLRTELLAQGIDFRYMPTFDNERKIRTIEFTVTANDGAINATGHHNNLQGQNAKVEFHVNKTNGTFTVTPVGDPSQH